MRWGLVAALAVVVVGSVGCGEGGSLPTDQDGEVTLPDAPALPPEGEDTPPSLWPLTAGSTWVYRINEPDKPLFEKNVEVLGPQVVPGTSVTATAVRSVQPHLEERSWQIELQNGLVARLREEDLKGGALARVMTWDPATVKSLARAQARGWSYESTIREMTRLSDGTEEEKQRTYVWSVVAVDETVSVPAGTFTNAIKVLRTRPDKPDKDRIYWLVPGVGKVREEGERTEELLSFDVKK